MNVKKMQVTPLTQFIYFIIMYYTSMLWSTKTMLLKQTNGAWEKKG